MNMQAEQPNPYAAPRATVSDAGDDEENVLAGRGARLGAIVLDGFIGGLLIYTPLVVGVGAAGLASIAMSGAGGNRADLFRAIGGALFGIAGLIALFGFFIWAGLTIYFVKKNGQTIGKKLLGIKVVRTDGSPASLGRIFWLRNVVNVLPSLIPIVGSLYGLVDALFIFSEPRRCVHDRIADTIVIKA